MRMSSAWKHFWVGSYDSNTSMSCLLSPSAENDSGNLWLWQTAPTLGVRFRVQQGDRGCRLAGGSSSLGDGFPLEAGHTGRADPNLLKGLLLFSARPLPHPTMFLQTPRSACPLPASVYLLSTSCLQDRPVISTLIFVTENVVERTENLRSLEAD